MTDRREQRSSRTPEIETSLPPEEITARLQRVDVAILDVDECLFPGYTQIELGHLIYRDLLRKSAGNPAYLSLFLRFTMRGLLLYLLKHLPGKHEQRNLMLHRHYIRTLRGIPRRLVLEQLPRVWRRLPSTVPTCLGFIGERVPVGIISLGWDIILQGLPDQLQRKGCPLSFRFTCANTTRWEGGRFVDLAPPVRVGPADKLSMFELENRTHGFKCPLVIGHNSDERQLCELARRQGGLSVGLGPRPSDRPFFDIRLATPDWAQLERFLAAHWR